MSRQAPYMNSTTAKTEFLLPASTEKAMWPNLTISELDISLSQTTAGVSHSPLIY